METPIEVYELLVKVVKACTGLNDNEAKNALQNQGVNEPNTVAHVPNPTPPQR